MAFCKNVLTTLPLELWPKLQEMFTQDWPKHYQAYETLKNYYKSMKEGKITGTIVFTLNNDWSDGTFMLQASHSNNIS